MKPDNISDLHDDLTDEDRECPQCGEASIATYWHQDGFTYGSGDSAVTLTAKLPVRRCSSCEIEFLDHEGERLRHEAVCRHLGVLSPSEISDVRKRYGMTRSAFAAVTGLGEATLHRWENGAVVQNLANDRYLRLLTLPGVMATLKELTNSPDIHIQQDVRIVRKFQVLIVTDKQRRSQESFELRMVS